LRFHFVHAGDYVAVEAGAGPGRKLKLRVRADAEGQVLKIYLRGFLQRGSKLFLIPKIMFGCRCVGLSMAFVIFYGSGKVFSSRFANRCRLIEEDDWTQGAFREFKKGGCARFISGTEEGQCFPGSVAVGRKTVGGHRPFGQRKQRGAHDGSDGTLCSGIEFADGFDGVAQEFDAHGAGRLRRENVDNAATNGELAGHLDHFGARVADRADVSDQFFERDFFVGSQGASK